MKKNFATRIWQGMGSSALAQLVGILNSVILVPLFLKAWGADGYGKWIALTALISYVSLLDLGGQSYIGNLLAIEYANNDEANFRKILSSGVSLFATISIFALLVIVLLLSVPSLPFPGLNQFLTYPQRYILLAMAVSLLISVTGGVYATVYRATGLYARGTMVGNITRLVGFGVSAGWLILSVTPLAYALSLLGINIFITLIVIWDTQRRVPLTKSIRINLKLAKEGATYLRGSINFWLIAIAGGIKQQGAIIVLAAFASPVTVALFSTHRAISGLLRYISSILQGPLWPEFSFLWAKRHVDKIERLVLSATTLSIISTGVFGVFVYILFPFVYPLWTGKHLEFDTLLISLLLMQGVLAAGWLTISWSLMASNNNKHFAIWSLFNAGVSVILAIILFPSMGKIGVAVASLIGDFIAGVIVLPKLTSKFLGISSQKVYLCYLYSVSALVPFIVLGIMSSILIQGYMAIILYTFSSALLILPILRFALGREEVERLVHHSRQIAFQVLRINEKMGTRAESK